MPVDGFKILLQLQAARKSTPIRQSSDKHSSCCLILVDSEAFTALILQLAFVLSCPLTVCRPNGGLDLPAGFPKDLCCTSRCIPLWPLICAETSRSAPSRVSTPLPSAGLQPALFPPFLDLILGCTGTQHFLKMIPLHLPIYGEDDEIRSGI